MKDTVIIILLLAIAVFLGIIAFKPQPGRYQEKTNGAFDSATGTVYITDGKNIIWLNIPTGKGGTIPTQTTSEGKP